MIAYSTGWLMMVSHMNHRSDQLSIAASVGNHHDRAPLIDPKAFLHGVARRGRFWLLGSAPEPNPVPFTRRFPWLTITWLFSQLFIHYSWFCSLLSNDLTILEPANHYCPWCHHCFSYLPWFSTIMMIKWSTIIIHKPFFAIFTNHYETMILPW